MKIQYTLSRSDLLNNQLYIASISERIKKKRRKSKLVVPLSYLILALLVLAIGYVTMAIVLVVFGVLWYIVYPQYLSSKYVMHYADFINENFAHLLSDSIFLTIDDDFIISKDKISEGKIKLTEIKSIIRLSDNYLINLGLGSNLVLPLMDIQKDKNVISTFVEKISEKTGLTIEDKSSWRWQ